MTESQEKKKYKTEREQQVIQVLNLTYEHFKITMINIQKKTEGKIKVSSDQKSIKNQVEIIHNTILQNKIQ